MRIEPGTRVLVTGGSRGAGLAVARELVRRGAVVGILGRSRLTVEDAARDLGLGTIGLTADVADRAALERAIQSFVRQAGGLDIVIVGAAVAGSDTFHEQSPAVLRRLVDVNVRGALHTVRLVLPLLLDQGSGHLALIGCRAGIHGMPGQAAYGATRAAIASLGGGLWHELAGTGVGVSTIIAGDLATGFHDAERDRLPEWTRPEEAADPAEFARAVLRAIERDQRTAYFPAELSILARWAGVAPRIYDFFLRQASGIHAAPQRRRPVALEREVPPSPGFLSVVPARAEGSEVEAAQEAAAQGDRRRRRRGGGQATG